MIPFSQGNPVVRPWCAVESDFRVPFSQEMDAHDFAVALTPQVKTAVREMSYLLREHDPRLGTLYIKDELKPSLPDIPLFDPPRRRPPAWNTGAGVDSSPCPFCSDGFGQGFPAMWGGGNLMWVHPKCWLQAHG